MLNEKIIAIDKGRDAGKTFKVKEMPVTKLEKWAARALLAVFGSEMPADIRPAHPDAFSVFEHRRAAFRRAPGALGAPVGTGRTAL